jgi:uroporphyrinogen decarboxylase
MTARERLSAALRGERPDRIPITFWRHFFREETTPRGLADAMLGFQDTYRWDLMKVNPRTYYCAESWGARLEWPEGPDCAPRVAEPVVRSERDWRLHRPDPGYGAFGEHLEALDIIRKHIDPSVPFITTIFSPTSIAGQIAGGDRELLEHIAEWPSAVQGALEAITETLVAFAREALALGADGIFFPTTHWATRLRLTPEQYARFARPYDLCFLEAIRDHSRILLLHVCREQNMLEDLLDYPVDIINWDSRDPSNPSIEKIRKITDLAVLGGLSARTLADRPVRECVDEAARAVEEGGGAGRFVLGSGCVILPSTPGENLRALKEWVQESANTFR